VTDAAVAFLGAIALATLVMAAIQVGAILYGVRLARRTEQLIARVEHDIGPIIERLTAMSTEASRATALAAHQVERIDRLVGEISEKVDRSMHVAQRALVAPAREGVALAAAFKATLGTLRDIRRQRRASRFRHDDDDALFIG
jgi:hypothetical protein